MQFIWEKIGEMLINKDLDYILIHCLNNLKNKVEITQ
jgi:hypothetical protein